MVGCWLDRLRKFGMHLLDASWVLYGLTDETQTHIFLIVLLVRQQLLQIISAWIGINMPTVTYV